MEDLFLNLKEHKILKRSKIFLENRFKVEIFIPDIKQSSLTDVIFGSIHGSKTNIGHVKEFMSRKINRSSKTNELKQPSGITLVTLSDSEEESVTSSSSEVDSISTDESDSKSSIRSSSDNKTDCSTLLENTVCIISSTKNSPKQETEDSPAVSIALPNDSVCFTECSSNSKAIANKYTGDLGKPCTASLEDTVYIMGSIKNSPKPETEGCADVSTVSLNDSVCFIGCSSNSKPVANKSCRNRDLGKLCSSNLEDNACIIGSTKNSQTESLSNSIISLNDSVCFIDCLPNSKPTTDNSWHAKNLGKPGSTSLDDSVCIIENAANTGNSEPDSPAVSIISPNDPVCIIECSSNSRPRITNKSWYTRDFCYTRQQKSKSKSQRRREIGANKRQKQVKLSASGVAEICKVTSTTEEPEVTGSRICTESQGSIKVLLSNNSEPAPEFISLSNNKKRRIEHTPDQRSKRKKENIPVSSAESQDGDDIIVLEPVTEVPVAAPRRLRPIVIDGSNVACTHGIVKKTFSSKGIQLCVEYFLSRGHTEVTAFVPNFRRHGDRKAFYPTTDPTIMEELAEKQHVVFTPSRYLNGQCFASYDDRFIVQLASQNGGVIVSNDNFKDLLGESDSFKEAIEKRLLKFCFVRDVFMVPEDPLGRKVPKLADYLSFPAEEPSTSK